MKLPNISLVFTGLIFLSAVAVHLFLSTEKQRGQTLDLAQLLPIALSGYTVRDLPVAESPEMQKATEAILRYDDVVFREYRFRDRSVQVYVSAWLPGKMDARHLALHHPDNCWTASGFTRIDDASKPLSEIGGHRVAAGQFRRFEDQGNPLEVVYWLMVDGKPFETVDESAKTDVLLKRLTTFCRTVWFGLKVGGKRSPICFARISSPVGLEACLADPTLQPVILALLPLIAGASEPL